VSANRAAIKTFPFSVDANSDYHAETWGEYCFIIGLPDNRECQVTASKYRVVDGMLELLKVDGEPGLSIAPGGWISIYAASVWDNSPVMVRHLGKYNDR
jgi:hypothetical protein